MTLKVIATISGLLLIKISAGLSPPLSCKHNGIYADPEDCTKFYMCSPCGPLQFYCPAGDFFDPEKKACARDDDHKCDPGSLLPSNQDVITPDVDITFVPNNFSCMIMVAVEDDIMEDISAENKYLSASDSFDIPADGDIEGSGDPTGQSEKPKVEMSNLYVDLPEEIIDAANTSEFLGDQFTTNAGTDMLEIASKTSITDNSPVIDNIGQKMSTVEDSMLPKMHNHSNISKEYSIANISRSTLDEKVLAEDITQINSKNVSSILNAKEYIQSNEIANLFISRELDNSSNATEAVTRYITDFNSVEGTNMDASTASNNLKNEPSRAKFKDITESFNFATDDNGTSNNFLDDNVNMKKEKDSEYSGLDSKSIGENAINSSTVHSTSNEEINVDDSDLEDTSEIIPIDFTRGTTVMNVIDSEESKSNNGNLTATVLEQQKMPSDEPTTNLNITNTTEPPKSSKEIFTNTNLGEESASTPDELVGEIVKDIGTAQSTVQDHVNVSYTQTMQSDDENVNYNTVQTTSTPKSASIPDELVGEILRDTETAQSMVQDHVNISYTQTTQSDDENVNYNTVQTTSTPMPRFSVSPGISDLVRDLLDHIGDYQELMNDIKGNLDEIKQSVPSHDDIENRTIAIGDIVAEHLYSSSDRHQHNKMSNYAILICFLYSIIILYM